MENTALYSRRNLLGAAMNVGMVTLTEAAFASESLAIPTDSQTNDTKSGIVVRTGQKFAFLGASITEFGWSHPTGYLQLVTNALAANGVNIVPIPAGVSGNTSRDMLARLDRDIIQRKPDWLTVDAGGNDIWHGSVPFDEYMTNMTAIVDKAQKAKIHVILQTCTPIMEDPNGEFNQKMAYYNQFQRYLAKQRNVVLADLNEAFLTILKAKTSPENILTTDGVHMNDRGNQLMATTLLKALGLTSV